MLKIIFFGDSICTGQHVSIHKGWVTNISRRFEGIAIVSNSSINGRTTRQALEDMPYCIQEQRPDILIVQFGMNDCNYWRSDKGVPRVSPKAFEANLEEIINRAYIFGVKRVFLNTNHTTGLVVNKMLYTDITYEESNKAYNEIIRKVARNSNVIFSDIEHRFVKYRGNKSRLLLADLFHLSKVGHSLYFNMICPTIKREASNI